MFQLAPSATWEFQQLVSLLEIHTQNVGVDTISSNSKTEKSEPSPDKCQILGIKLAHTADISDQPIKLPPLNSNNKPPPFVQKLTPKSSKTTP